MSYPAVVDGCQESDHISKIALNTRGARAVHPTRHLALLPVLLLPDRVEREQRALIQVFLHAPQAQKQVEAAAGKFDPESRERGHRSLVLDAPIGTTFAFDVEVEGFAFHERIDTLIWTGRPQSVAFGFRIPKHCKCGQHTRTMRIAKDNALVGRISFQIEVVRDAPCASQQPVGEEVRHYHACFCSYSSLDRAEMLKRAQGLPATGWETFIDVLSLRPGDIWTRRFSRPSMKVIYSWLSGRGMLAILNGRKKSRVMRLSVTNSTEARISVLSPWKDHLLLPCLEVCKLATLMRDSLP